MEQVIMPTVRGMAAEGNVYTGFLYAGLMIDADGNPKVIEFNCRFGDPETQPIMLRLRSDLVELCERRARRAARREGRMGPARRTRRGDGRRRLPGRVLCVTALGDSVAAAQALAYRNVAQIQWRGAYCRRDIGYRAVARERQP
jgi:phosphoribosylamine--glycine ligase